MKKLIIINGTMGVGKTTVCRQLYRQLDHAVWLDGDWCWLMHPWEFSAENKAMVMDNISHLLRNFLNNSTFKYVVFSWVMHEQAIFAELLDRLAGCDFQPVMISLTCTAETLAVRMKQDGGTDEAIRHSTSRLELYQQLDTIKIDATDRSVDAVVDEIVRLVGQAPCT